MSVIPLYVNANRLAHLRRAAGLSRREIGRLLDRPASDISRYEAGKSAIPDEHQVKLASAFGVSVSFLMGWDEDGLEGAGRTADAPRRRPREQVLAEARAKLTDLAGQLSAGDEWRRVFLLLSDALGDGGGDA